MTSKEFVIWMKGFAAGSSRFNLTPEGWDELKSQLEKVNDDTILMGGLLNDHNTFKTYLPASPHHIGDTQFGTTTSTTYEYPSRSTWSYTNNTYNSPYTIGGEADNIKKEPHNED